MPNTISRKTGELSPPKKVAVLLGINIFIAVIVPLLLDAYDKHIFSLTNEIVIGFLIAITMSLAELLFLTQHIYETEISQTELWCQTNEIDGIVSNIREHIHRLISNEGKDSFYFAHYKNELLWLEGRLKNTTDRKEIVLDRHHIDATGALLSIFDDPKHKIFRATHLLWDTSEEFDVTFKVYYMAWLEKVRARKVAEIRRLFVYRDESDFKMKNVMKILAFHNGITLPVHAKIVSRMELGRFKSDFNINDGVEDFGIFSDLYMYLGSTRNRNQIAGTFSKDSGRINLYISCFDALWNSLSVKPISHFSSIKIDENQLFDNTFTLPLPKGEDIDGHVTKQNKKHRR